MTWESKTERFSPKIMVKIENLSPTELRTYLLSLQPLTAVRILGELYLHEDFNRLRILVTDPEIDAHWRQYGLDPRDTAEDLAIEVALKEKFGLTD